MKKFLGVSVLVVTMFFTCLFTVGADKSYTVEDMSFSVPDFLQNDPQWAESSDFAFAFSDTDENMEFNISVYENEGYSYSGLDEDGLEQYASFISDQYGTGSYYPIESVKVTNHNLENGVEGIRIHILFTEEQFVFYWFATESTCYDLNFYIYNEAYLGHTDDIIATLSIGPAIEETTVPVTEDADVQNGAVPELDDDVVTADGNSEIGKDEIDPIKLLPILIIALVLMVAVAVVIRKKKSEKDTQTYLTSQNNDTGIFYDPNTGKYYKRPSPEQANLPPDQPIGYIYYPCTPENKTAAPSQTNTDNQQNNQGGK